MVRDPSRLSAQTFDLLIIGGGIMGAGVAWDAAQRGLSCALVEQGDFASGTSSKTTKLIHGGIRYLEGMEFGLVRQSIRERGTLLKLVPHLVKPLSFLIPVIGQSPRPWPLVRIGVSLYDWMARGSSVARHRILNRSQIAQAEPLLSESGVGRAALYQDAQMDDARLVLETLQKASAAGAAILNYCAVTGWVIENGRVSGAELEDRIHGKRYRARATAVLNATGPWVDRLRNMADPALKPIVRPSKGIHLVYADLGLKQALLLSSPRDRRIFFLIPWRNSTLIGTTDTDYQGDPAHAIAEPEDVAYLLDETNRLLPKLRLEKGGILSTFAGVRPLAAQEKKDPWAVSRAHLLHEDSNGLVSLVGGKFTTFRSVAEQVVDRLACRFPGKRLLCCSTAESVLGPQYGSADRLVQRYGTGAGEILEWVRADQRLADPLCPHHPFIRAEVRYAVEKEMALTLGDLLWRRFQVGWSACQGLDMLPAAAEWMGGILAWTPQEKSRQLDQYKAEIASNHRWNLG